MPVWRRARQIIAEACRIDPEIGRDAWVELLDLLVLAQRQFLRDAVLGIARPGDGR